MPRRRKGRDVHGVLLLDKPAGPTSNAMLQRVRRLYEARRAGHGGTLDPFATGLLPVCFGEATKFSAALLEGDKRYVATARLGVATATGDPDGDPVDAAGVPDLDWAGVETVMTGFLGEIEQVPPMYSALKQNGRRLYEIARSGEEVTRVPRRVTIHSLRLLALDSPEFRFEVTCGKGTYIRTLVEDIAAALGTVGHTRVLRRVGVGPFDGATMVDADELEGLSQEALEAHLLPVDAGISDWPLARVADAEAQALVHGRAVVPERDPDCAPGLVRLYFGESFLGVGELAEDGRIRPRRLVASGSSR